MMKNILVIMLTILVVIFLGCNSEQNQVSTLTVPFIDTGVDENSWVLIPAGKFYKGQHNNETEINHNYEIMLTDVTNAQYAKYLNDLAGWEMILSKLKDIEEIAKKIAEKETINPQEYFKLI